MMARRASVVEQVDRPQLVGGGWWLVHGLPLVAPGIGCLVWAGLVAGAHQAWGGSPIVTPLMAIVLLVAGGLITGYAWLATGKRQALRIAVTVSGGAATLTLVLGLIFGLGQLWLLSVYVICAVIVWILWGIWRAAKYAGHNGSDASGATPLLEAVRDAKVRFSKPAIDERGVVRAQVHTLPGGTLEDARGLVPLLSADSRAVPGGSHLAGDHSRDGVGTLEIPTRDNLARALPWPGAAALAGRMPTEFFPVAEYQSGIAQVRLVGDASVDPHAEDIKHVKIGGTTGSGKSVAARVLLGSILPMRRVNVIGIDITKRLQTFGVLASALDWVIVEDEVARVFMGRLPHLIAGRTDHLAGEGLMRWTPASSLNLLVIHVEESKAFHRFQAAYERAVADSRSAGILWVSSTQDWIYRNVSTSVRKLHGAGICFGLEEAGDAEHVLPEAAIAALGKSGLPTWGSNRPGTCYIAGLGVPQRHWSRMARFYEPPEEALREAVELAARFHDPVDVVTADLLGVAFANRTRYPAPTQTPVTAPQPVAPRQEAAAEERGDIDDEMAREDAETMTAEEYTQDRQEMREELDRERRRLLGEDGTPADFADVDPDEPIALLDDAVDLDEEDEEDDVREMSPEEAQRVWDRKLDDLYRAGRRHLQTSDLVEWLGEVGRARTFLYRQRDRWQEAGLIAPRPDADGWDLLGSPLEESRREPPSPPHGE